MVAHQPKYGHPPTLGWSPTRRKCTTDLEFSTYILLTKLTSGYLLTKLTPGYLPTLRGSHTNPRSVAHQPKYGHPPTLGWSPTRKKCTTDMEFGTYTLLQGVKKKMCHSFCLISLATNMLGKVGSIASSEVQKLFSTIFGS